jgi:hypothetical protein
VIKKKRLIISIIGIIMLLAGIGAGIYLVRRQQLLEKKAAVSGGVAEMYLNPQTKTVNFNEPFTVDIVVDANNHPIKVIDAVLNLPESNNYIIEEVMPNAELAQSTLWGYTPYPSKEIVDGMHNIRFVLFYGSHEGYENPEPFVIGRIRMRGFANSTMRMSINPSLSTVQSAISSSDILNSNLNPIDNKYAAVYTIGTGDGGEITPTPTLITDPTVTLTPVPGTTATPTPTTGTVPTHSPTPSPTLVPGTSPIPTRTPTPLVSVSPGPSSTPWPRPCWSHCHPNY